MNITRIIVCRYGSETTGLRGSTEVTKKDRSVCTTESTLTKLFVYIITHNVDWEEYRERLSRALDDHDGSYSV